MSSNENWDESNKSQPADGAAGLAGAVGELVGAAGLVEGAVGTSWGQNLLFKDATVDRMKGEKGKGGTARERIKGKGVTEGKNGREKEKLEKSIDHLGRFI